MKELESESRVGDLKIEELESEVLCADSTALVQNMDAACFSKVLLLTYQTPWYHNSEGNEMILQS
jgi:hypothetical protein